MSRKMKYTRNDSSIIQVGLSCIFYIICVCIVCDGLSQIFFFFNSY